MSNHSGQSVGDLRPGQDILVRALVDGQSAHSRVLDGTALATRDGATYTFFDPTTFQRILIRSATQEGLDLIILLADGRLVRLADFFEQDPMERTHPRAMLDDDISIQMQNQGFGHSPAVEPLPTVEATLDGASHNSPRYPSYQPSHGYGGDGLVTHAVAAALGAGLVALTSRSYAATGSDDDLAATIDELKKTLNDHIDDQDNTNEDQTLNNTVLDEFDKLNTKIEELQDELQQELNEANQDIQDLQDQLDDALDNGQQSGSSGGSNSIINALTAVIELLSKNLSAGTPIIINNNVGDGNSIGGGISAGSTNNGSTSNSSPSVVSVRHTDGLKEVRTGDQFTIDIAFSEEIFITGNTENIKLQLTTGEKLDFIEKSSTNVLQFGGAISSATNTSIIAEKIIIGSAAIKNSANADVQLTIPLIKNDLFNVVDAKVAEIDTNISDGAINPTSDMHGAIFRVKFTDPINVDTTDGTPYLTLSSGGIAVYESGSGTTDLIFSYMPETGEVTQALQVIGIVESGSLLKTQNGTYASLEISEDVSSQYFGKHDIIVDLDRPEITDVLNDLSLGSQETEKDGAIYKPINGQIKISFDELVIWDYESGTKPYLAIPNVFTSANANELARLEISEAKSPSNVASTEFIFDVDGFVEVANDLIVSDLVPEIILNNSSATDIYGNSILTQVNYGAGRFDSNSITFEFIDNLIQAEFESKEPRLVRIIDLNGNEPNYLDEVTGEFIDLSSQFYSANGLRSISSTNIEIAPTVITPLSELSIRAVEKLEISPIDQKAHIIYKEIGKNLGLNDIFSENLIFTTDQEIETVSSLSSQYNYAIVLAALSGMDAVTGSIDKTIEVFSDYLVSESPVVKQTFFDVIQEAKRHIELSTMFADEELMLDVVCKLDDFKNLQAHVRNAKELEVEIDISLGVANIDIVNGANQDFLEVEGQTFDFGLASELDNNSTPSYLEEFSASTLGSYVNIVYSPLDMEIRLDPTFDEMGLQK